jgi:hypothetical protein
MQIKKWRNFIAVDGWIEIKIGAYLIFWKRKKRIRSNIQRAWIRYGEPSG